MALAKTSESHRTQKRWNMWPLFSWSQAVHSVVFLCKLGNLTVSTHLFSGSYQLTSVHKLIDWVKSIFFVSNPRFSKVSMSRVDLTAHDLLQSDGSSHSLTKELRSFEIYWWWTVRVDLHEVLTDCWRESDRIARYSGIHEKVMCPGGCKRYLLNHTNMSCCNYYTKGGL